MKQLIWNPTSNSTYINPGTWIKWTNFFKKKNTHKLPNSPEWDRWTDVWRKLNPWRGGGEESLSKNNPSTNKIIWNGIKSEESNHLLLRLTVSYNNQHSIGSAEGLTCIEQWKKIGSSEIELLGGDGNNDASASRNSVTREKCGTINSKSLLNTYLTRTAVWLHFINLSFLTTRRYWPYYDPRLAGRRNRGPGQMACPNSWLGSRVVGIWTEVSWIQSLGFVPTRLLLLGLQDSAFVI